MNYIRLNRGVLYIALCSLSFFACSSSESKDAQFLISALGFDHLDNQVILSIPINGCSGCAQESIAFAKDHFDKNDFFITLIGDDKKEAVLHIRGHAQRVQQLGHESTTIKLLVETNSPT